MHFFYPYAGNKRSETDTLIKLLGISKDERLSIVEPFCGTSAMSYAIYKQFPGYDLNFYLNDIDEELIAVYNLFKTVDAKVIEIKLMN